ncbi:FlgB family protein (plasmid) [Paracoccus sp. TK19116]|uniref:FlgB family protein n=1 Tax=Paracoccus albicereus TaxID=2922394 RepID=A0ABT1MMU7_9RHOB|nr:FlgB family protein [Paracoccus albicereus]MCQ0969109.1 FlgB family protein [Paracoccus albicereus]
MFDRIETLRMAKAMTNHAAERQRIVARNIANADTPGYAAADVRGFTESYRSDPARFQMRATDPRHMSDPGWVVSRTQFVEDATGASPNGNAVSIEDEMVKMADVKREQDLALAVYRNGLDILRTSLGRRA